MDAGKTYTRTYTKKGSTTKITVIPIDGGLVELTMQRWAPSGRRLMHNQSRMSLRGAGVVLGNRCSDLEKRGWVKQDEIANTCRFETTDGNSDDPTSYYCGLPHAHIGDHGDWKS